MPTHSRRSALVARRRAMGYSQERLATAIGVDQSTVARWEQGRTNPYPEHLRRLAKALAVDLDALDRLLIPSDVAPQVSGVPARSDSMVSPEGATVYAGDLVSARPWTARDTAEAIRALVEGGYGTMDRRSFLILSGSALTSPAHDWLVSQSVDETIRRSGRAVEPSVINHLGEITDSIRRMDDRVGGGSLVNVVLGQVTYVQALLRDGRYTDSVGRDLWATMAELLRLAGWIYFDTGRHGEAQRYFVSALRGAHAAGDRALGANILGFMSCQAKDIGQPREAIKLADSARAGYPGASPTVTAIVNMRVAQAYANADDVAGTRRAIDAALTTFGETKPQHGEPAWSYWLDEAQINEQVGYCYMRIGDWPQAREHLLSAISDTSSREGVLRQAFLADTYAQQGEPEAACRTGTEAVDALLTHVDSARCVGHIQSVRDHLQPFAQLSCVQDFAERVQQMELMSA